MASAIGFAQDVLRCEVCPGEEPDRSAVQVFCNVCHVKLCGSCVPHHMSSDKTRKHEIVLYTARNVPQMGLVDDPKILITVETGCRDLYGVKCIKSDQFWVSGCHGYSYSLLCMDKKSSCLETRNNKHIANSLTCNSENDLIFCDDNGNVRIIQNDKSLILISRVGWKARAVCCTSSNETLVCFLCNESEKCEVVRYLGTRATQEILLDDNGKPIYTAYPYGLYFMDANKNGDICVTDSMELVVVNHAGKFRFRYKGNPQGQKKNAFLPRGIVTDSSLHILVGDINNHCVHILDQNGQFLSYITCGGQLEKPVALSIDSFSLLAVAEHYTAKVKFIEYQK